MSRDKELDAPRGQEQNSGINDKDCLTDISSARISAGSRSRLSNLSAIKLRFAEGAFTVHCLLLQRETKNTSLRRFAGWRLLKAATFATFLKAFEVA